jgi:hypothetical protein
VLSGQGFFLFVGPEYLGNIVNGVARRVWILRKRMQVLVLRHLRNELFQRRVHATTCWCVLVAHDCARSLSLFQFHKHEFLLPLLVQNYLHGTNLCQQVVNFIVEFVVFAELTWIEFCRMWGVLCVFVWTYWLFHACAVECWLILEHKTFHLFWFVETLWIQAQLFWLLWLLEKWRNLDLFYVFEALFMLFRNVFSGRRDKPEKRKLF